MTTSAPALGGFRVCVDFDGPRAVLTLRGELDCFWTPQLHAIITTVIGQGYRSVVLDVADLDFMDAAGLGVFAQTAAHLGAAAGTLTIRSPSPMVRRILDITGLAGLTSADKPGTSAVPLGAVESLNTELAVAAALNAQAAVDLPEATHKPARPGVGWPLRKLTAMPTDDTNIDGALRLLVALARATVSGADGVSVSLLRHGRLRTVAASDQTIADMDGDQYTTGEGPCVDASEQGRWFHAKSLATETRWPSFTPKAHGLGIHAILSSPLLVAERPVGALNMYSRTATAFTPANQKLAAVFASEASTILTAAGAGATDDELSLRWHQALVLRQNIAHAQGVIMGRDGISPEDAYTLLRQASKRSGQPMRNQAMSVIATTLRPPANLAPPAPVQPHD